MYSCEYTSHVAMIKEYSTFKISEAARTDVVSIDAIKQLVKEEYGLNVTAIKRENGYCTMNFSINVADTWENPHIAELCHSGYLLKVYKYQSSVQLHTGESLFETIYIYTLTPQKKLRIFLVFYWY